ncbi:glycoside hydrolase family 3 C-terminal domain-containing protein [Fournierella sp.]|uniref:glycoside hydrolase family 3 C-terminal domain-containing protein n=1 Tax=Allofournierella sp. TaxID=1940256 RepID=UPI0025BCB8BC|nr:glycoside hydrolase family 3 C-terminal domain-containing protein [Fournierella sp.]
MKNTSAKRALWRGLTSTTASLLALTIAATPLVNGFRTDIDKFLGTKSQMIVTDSEEDPSSLYTYTSDYANTTELVQAIADLGERMSEEGTVLLKNNGALPLSQEETQKISLLGFSSYYPVMGGDMGSSLTANEGTDADTVDFVEALAAKGFAINPTLQSLYTSLEPMFKTEVNMWGNIVEYYNITTPSTTGYFTSKEPSQSAMNEAQADWKDSLNEYNVMVVTLARSASENGTYLPGEAGVDPSQDLNQADALSLSDDERDLVQAAIDTKAANGGKVIVLLNNASAMEVEELESNEGVDAILQIGLPGGYGFYGVADVLSGAANPSGHLSDTYAVDNSAAPSAQNFGNFAWTNADASISANSILVEAEGIYVGYKYYETRYMDSVLGQGNATSTVGSSNGSAWNYDSEVTYPFGYGLSYTTFSQTLDSLNVDLAAGTVTAQVTVTNTGSVAGKDVVQLYTSLPYTDYDKQNGVEKAGVQLLDYAKTEELAPGESETVTITADAQYMASWDSSRDNIAGTKGTYILDAGTYYFTIGNGSHEAANNVLAAQGKTVAEGMTAEGNAANVQTWELAELDDETFARSKNGTVVENQLEDMDLNYWMPGTATYMTRSDWEGTFPKTYEGLTATDEMMEYLDCDVYEISADNGDPNSVTFGADNGLTLADLKGVTDMEDPRWEALMDQITLEDCMIRTAFGGTSTKAIESIMSPEVIQNDGPNGIYSYTLGQYANTDTSSGDPCAIGADDPNANYKAGVMPSPVVIGQTFSKQLAREYGELMGNYSLWSNLTIYWGCGNNIHRSPYNARNHEYYSEDAMLTAYQGAAFVEGGLEYGLIIAPKHFAFNDIEINRTGISVFMTEQQARENELRGTQPIIEDTGALGIMTAYNRVGVTTSNAHTGLLQNILRGEWGFKGLATEDFIQDALYTSLKEAVMNGITMSCNTGDSTLEAVAEKFNYWTVENVSQDAQLMAALKQAMTWQNYAIANSNALDGMSSSSELVSVRTWYDNALTGAAVAFGVLTVLCAVMYVRAAKKKEQ